MVKFYPESAGFVTNLTSHDVRKAGGVKVDSFFQQITEIPPINLVTEDPLQVLVPGLTLQKTAEETLEKSIMANQMYYVSLTSRLKASVPQQIRDNDTLLSSTHEETRNCVAKCLS